MVKTFYFYNIISLLLLCYLLILSMPQVFEQSLFLFVLKLHWGDGYKYSFFTLYSIKLRPSLKGRYPEAPGLAVLQAMPVKNVLCAIVKDLVPDYYIPRRASCITQTKQNVRKAPWSPCKNMKEELHRQQQLLVVLHFLSCLYLTHLAKYKPPLEKRLQVSPRREPYPSLPLLEWLSLFA